MRNLTRGRVSPALVISIVALVLAVGGTSFASAPIAFIAKATGLNSTQKKQVKSIADKEIKSRASKLSVFSAKTATSAATATNATNATSAANAANAGTLGGQSASAFEASAHFIRTGLITAKIGQTVPLASFGPFTLTLKCSEPAPKEQEAAIEVTSTEANSDVFGKSTEAAGKATTVIAEKAKEVFKEAGNNTVDFFSPSGRTYQGFLTAGVNFLGAKCFANALVITS